MKKWGAGAAGQDGAAKGGVDRFLEGLRNRLFRSGVSVLTIKPGFVDAPMTAGVRAEEPALRQSASGRARHLPCDHWSVVYIPWFWRPIMFRVTALPESIFQRLRW